MKQTDPLLAIVEKRYQLPHWIFIPEFRNATGFDSTRSADALAFGMYRSRGQSIIGFEVKTARSDWLRELKSPAKGEPIAAYCDYFNLVINDPSIAKVEELPDPWGLIVVDVAKGKSRFVKVAQRIDALPLARS